MLVIVSILLGLGPLMALGIWLWLRSRRGPVMLVEGLDIGRVLAGSVAAFRRENWALIGLAAVLIGVPQLAWLMATGSSMDSSTVAPRGTLTAPLTHIFTRPFIGTALLSTLVQTAFCVAAILFLARRAEGDPISLRGALAVMQDRFLLVFAATLLSYFGIMLGTILFVLPGVVLALSWLVVIPVLIVERAGLIDAFRRSRALSMGSRGRIASLLLLVLVLVVIVAAIKAILTVSRIGGIGAVGVAMDLLIGLASPLIYAGFVTALYKELCRIREGGSIPTLAEVFA